jgi:alanine transaminase
MNSCYSLNNEFYSYHNLNTYTPSPQARAMFVINPSSPTGKVLNLPEMQKIIKFCVENNLVLIASEVLQDLTHKDNSFLSFRSVISSMPYPYNKLEHFSFYSASKNWMFEGSARAGYLKIMNIDQDVKMELYKHISMDICSSVTGQIIMDIITSPPSTDEFGKNYQLSLKNSKKYLIENFNTKIEKLKNFGIFKNVYHPEAGFSLFLEINKDEKLSQGNLPCEYSDMPCCEIFSRMLFEETGVLTTPGTEYGNFPNHVGINFSHNYPSEEEIERMGKFFYARKNNFSSNGIKFDNEKLSSNNNENGEYVKIKNASFP